MASRRGKPELHRVLSLLLLGTLAGAALALGAGQAAAQSGYRPARGDMFFLLSDRTYSSAENALIRLEWASSYGSAADPDVRLYRVPNPVEFLKRQKNPHRVSLPGSYRGEGLANAVSYLWDVWYKKSRMILQRMFSSEARGKVTAQNSDLKEVPPHLYAPRYEDDPQFTPIEGLELLASFRYPVWMAEPIKPPKETVLAGSSSSFIHPRNGNVYVPLGVLKPGLYLVEGFNGAFHATALVFVSDTVVVTKVSGDQTLIWSVDQQSGLSAPGTKILLTDGVGTLGQGVTDASGLLQLNRKSPERSYVIGEDAKGGAFISENFYFDSEIYQPKVYLFTDRPLYRPGDVVHVKLMGRAFSTAGDSETIAPLPRGTGMLTLVDAVGIPIATQKLPVDPLAGGQADFRLPTPANSGGYSLKLQLGDAEYGAAFRVVDFVKPHFEMRLQPGKKAFKTQEPITGQIQLVYPSGKPVAGAQVELNVRMEKLTMAGAVARYSGGFPVQMQATTLQSDAQGVVRLNLPAVKEPSRYIVRALAADKKAYRVSMTGEIVIRGYGTSYLLVADQDLTQPGAAAGFSIQRVAEAAQEPAPQPAGWEAIRLEDQSRTQGALPAGAATVAIPFAHSGSYSVRLLDGAGNVLGTQNHWVQGPELKSPPGQIVLVPDKESYEIGETATVLIGFPQPVKQALVTVERNQVAARAFLTDGEGGAIKISRVSDSQWAARVVMRKEYSPNVVLSVAYVSGQTFAFQNKGLLVKKPRIEVQLTPEKREYAPGEKVRLRLQTLVGGKGLPANVTLGVVDELIYVLQPEIAPNIEGFFYHFRRNQVRTVASLGFYSFDAAQSAAGKAPDSTAAFSQRLKLGERTRRDNVDTAFWAPRIRTDASGQAMVEFAMPDSLTRWRITARAVDDSGLVGQSVGYVTSTKDVYSLWTGPRAFRQGDRPEVPVLVFNNTGKDQTFDIAVSAEPGRLAKADGVTVPPGARRLDIKDNAFDTQGISRITVKLIRGGTALDGLETDVRVTAPQPPATESMEVPLGAKEGQATLPMGARNIRMKIVPQRSAQFLRIADDLMDVPYGGVEQTASRLIPLALAAAALKDAGADPAVADELANRVSSERLRLIQMAGPNATFAWWGNLAGGSSFLTTYAYYADFKAGQAMGVSLPASNWERVLQVYAKESGKEPLLLRATSVWLASEMSLPTQTLTAGLMGAADTLLASVQGGPTPVGGMEPSRSAILGDGDSPIETIRRQLSVVMIGILAKKNGVPLSARVSRELTGAVQALADGPSPVGRALVLLYQSGGKASAQTAEKAQQILAKVRGNMPSIDRALTLALLDTLLGGQTAAPKAPDVRDPWKASPGRIGVPVWTYSGPANPQQALTVPLPAVGAPMTAYLSYETAEVEASKLPVKIERRFYLVKTGSEFLKEVIDEPLNPAAPLDSQEVYLDEVQVTATAGGYSYGMLEVPVPPGADVRDVPWGVELSRQSGGQRVAIPVEAFAREEGDQSYRIPIPRLEGTAVFRQFVRFSLPGQFVLPRARFFRVYQPQDKAFEDVATGARTITVR